MRERRNMLSKGFLALLFIVVFSCLSSTITFAAENEFKCKTLYKSGEDKESIVFVILGDGFTEKEQDLFESKAEELMNYILATEPFNEMKEYMNFYCVDVISKESGAGMDPQKPLDTYFGSCFNSWGIERLLCPTKESNIKAVLNDYCPLYDAGLVLVNSTKYGGSGGSYATASINESSYEIMIHEMGHSIADLADEYWAGDIYAGEYVNMTSEDDPNSVAWSDLIGVENVGVYPYEESPGWYRPSQTCKMRYLGKKYGFCPVCRRAMTKRLSELRYTCASGVIKFQKQKQEIAVSSISKKISERQLNKRSISFSINAKAQTDLQYEKISGSEGISVSSEGYITVNKKLPRGTHMMKVKITAKENEIYEKADKTITIRVHVVRLQPEIPGCLLQ